MKKKAIITLMLILSVFIVETPPMAKADGSISAQEVNAEFTTTVSPPAYDGVGDSLFGIENDFRGAPLDLSDLQGFDLEMYQATAKIVGTSTEGQLMKMGVYEYLAWNDGGALYGESQPIAITDADIFRTFSFSPYASIPSDDSWVFIGCIAQVAFGSVELWQDSETGAMSITDVDMTYGVFDNPLAGESGGNGTGYLVRGKFYGDKSTTTTFNQYYGNTTDYVARRDIDADFPTGVTSREITFTYPRTENLLNITYYNGGAWDLALSPSDYTQSSLNSTHYLIEISETTISSYGDNFRIFTNTFDYNYILHGLFYENGTFAGDVNVTAVTDSGPVEYNVNGTLVLSTNIATMFFFWDISGGGTRRIYTMADTETLYLFTPHDTYSSYSFDITDYIGAIGFQDSYLELYAVTNSTTYLVERYLIWDSESESPLTAMLNKVYSLQIILPSDNEYSFGYWVPTTSTPPLLTLSVLDPDDYYQPISGVVDIEATRPTTTHVQIEYEDKMDLTLSVFVNITLRNETTVYNVTGGSAVETFNWYGAVNTTEYVVNVDVSHTYYGEITYSLTLIGEADYDDPPSWAILGIEDQWVYLGAVVVVAGTVSMVNAAVGLFAGACVASAFVYLNLVEIPNELLAGAFIIAILMGLTKR